MKPFRCTFSEYKAWKERFLKESPGYQDWLDASTNTLDKKEIMMRAILATQDGKQQICFSLMLSRNKFTVDEMNNILFINSGMFSFATWTDECVAFVIDLLKQGTDKDIKPILEEVAKGGQGAYSELPVEMHRFCKSILGDISVQRRRKIESIQCNITDTLRCSLWRKQKIASYKAEIKRLSESFEKSKSKYERTQIKTAIVNMQNDIRDFEQREKDAETIVHSMAKDYYKALNDTSEDTSFKLSDRFNWIDIYRTQKLPETYYDSMDALFTASERNKRAEIRAKKKAR